MLKRFKGLLFCTNFPVLTQSARPTSHTTPTLDSEVDVTQAASAMTADEQMITAFLIANQFSRDLNNVNVACNLKGTASYLYNPLTLAVKLKDLGMSRLLIEKADAGVNAPNALGNTALHIAMDTKDPLIINMLIDKGASLEIANKNKETPRDIAKRIKIKDENGCERTLFELLGLNQNTPRLTMQLT